MAYHFTMILTSIKITHIHNIIKHLFTFKASAVYHKNIKDKVLLFLKIIFLIMKMLWMLLNIYPPNKKTLISFKYHQAQKDFSKKIIVQIIIKQQKTLDKKILVSINLLTPLEKISLI